MLRQGQPGRLVVLGVAAAPGDVLEGVTIVADQADAACVAETRDNQAGDFVECCFDIGTQSRKRKPGFADDPGLVRVAAESDFCTPARGDIPHGSDHKDALAQLQGS